MYAHLVHWALRPGEALSEVGVDADLVLLLRRLLLDLLELVGGLRHRLLELRTILHVDAQIQGNIWMNV